MTTTITIELTTENPDSTWGDVLNCINDALTPADKDMRLRDTPRYAGSNEYRFESKKLRNSYHGVQGTSVLRVQPEVPTGLGAVVQSGSSSTLYTRLVSGRWISSASGTYYPDHYIQDLLGHGATVLFEGVQQ